KPGAPRPDLAVDAAGPEATHHGEREVGGYLAVHRLGLDVCGDAFGQVEGNPTVHRAKIQPAWPRGAFHRGADRAVHGFRLRVSGGGHVHAPVDGVDLHVALERFDAHITVHGGADEAHARGHVDRELNANVVIVGVIVTLAVLATVRFPPPARRVDGADGHPVAMLQHLDLHLLGIAPPGSLHRRDLDVGPGRRQCPDVAVHSPDFDRLSLRDATLPLE